MKAGGDREHYKPEPPAIRPTEEIEKIHAGEWKAWLANLTPDEIAQLERLGLTAPEAPRRGRRKRREEPEEEDIGLGTCEHLPSDTPDPSAALMAKEETIDPDKRQELVLLTQVLPHISDAKDARLEASMLALALKVGARQGITVGGLAHLHLFEHDEIHRGVRSWAVRLDTCRADVELLRYVIAPILASRSPGLEAEAIAKAARIGLSNSGRMEDAGLKHGVCRQAISRRVRQWCDDLSKMTGVEFPLPRECKRNTENYRLYNVRKQAVDPFK